MYQVILGHVTAAVFDRFQTDPSGSGALVYELLLNPPPIGDVSLPGYFTTPRGALSLQNLILRRRAFLVAQSRAYKVDYECHFEKAAALSCRMNALVHDFELPGGQALGKVVKYGIKGNGDTGLVIGNVSIACAAGFGAAVTESQGAPTVAMADVLGPDVQYFADAVTVLGTGDVGYTPPAYAAIDDGLIFPLTKQQAVVAETVVAIKDPITYTINSLVTSTQVGYGLAYGPAAFAQASQNAIQLFNASVSASQTWYTLTLKPVQNGPFSAEYDLITTSLQIPQQVNFGE